MMREDSCQSGRRRSQVIPLILRQGCQGHHGHGQEAPGQEEAHVSFQPRRPPVPRRTCAPSAQGKAHAKNAPREREMPRLNVDQMSPHLHSPVSLPMVVSVPPPLSTPLPSWVRSLCPLNPSAKFLTRRTSCRVPDRRGAGAGWKRLQGPQGSSNLLHLNLRAFPDTTLCSLSTLNSHRSSVSRPAICSSPFAEMRSSTP